MPFRIIVALVIVSFFAVTNARAQRYQTVRSNQPAAELPPPPSTQSDLFEASLGFNYIYLNDQFPETRNLYGVDGSLFVNALPWLAVGGDFMADFGSHSVPVFFRQTVDVDSERYVYVFGPRVTVWRNRDFRIFVEGLVGGVHAHATVSVPRFPSVSRSADANGFATALGGGFDWRFTNHLSWRVVQADYVGTDLSSQWQSDFRASTAIVYSFGRP